MWKTLIFTNIQARISLNCVIYVIILQNRKIVSFIFKATVSKVKQKLLDLNIIPKLKIKSQSTNKVNTIQ